jgi:tellurite resistance protein TerC
MNEIPLWWWVAFNAFVITMLALDLGVFHRKAHVVSIKEALGWSAVWIAMALAFNVWVYLQLGPQKGTEFLTGYLIEKSLSVDNVFVFAVLFTYFGIPPQYQHRVLFWGIFGALVMRAAMIFAGAALISNFSWIIYVFAALLVFTGIKMAMGDHESIDPEKNIALRLLRRLMPVTNEFHGQKFFVRQNGVRAATPSSPSRRTPSSSTPRTSSPFSDCAHFTLRSRDCCLTSISSNTDWASSWSSSASRCPSPTARGRSTRQSLSPWSPGSSPFR